jgi:uncharacterized protein (DUF2141 family)
MLALLLSHGKLLSQDEGKLVITYTDIRNTRGQLILAIYNHENQWTDNPYRTVISDKKELRNGKLVVVVPGMQRGKTYACALLDDEDGSMNMDYFCGVPKEGWGMSRNPSFLKLKAPSYEEVSFKLDGPVLRFEIKMNYILKNKNSR